MSLRADLKVPKYRLFYFPSDRTISTVPLKNVSKAITGTNVTKRSMVEIKYENLTVEAKIIGVNGT